MFRLIEGVSPTQEVFDAPSHALGDQLFAQSREVYNLIFGDHSFQTLLDLGFPKLLVDQWRQTIQAERIPGGFSSMEDLVDTCLQILSDKNLKMYADGSIVDLSSKRGSRRTATRNKWGF